MVERIRVRDAHAGDEASIVRLIKTLAEVAGGTSPLDEDYVRVHLDHPDCRILLAELDEAVVGLLSYAIRPDLYHAAACGLIDSVVVDDRVRGRGVGTALVSEVLRRLTEGGCAEVSVSTLPENHTAVRFYRSLGLVDEAVLLEKHLRTPQDSSSRRE